MESKEPGERTPADDAPGRPESPGKSEEAPGHNKSETKPAAPETDDPAAETKPAAEAVDRDDAEPGASTEVDTDPEGA